MTYRGAPPSDAVRAVGRFQPGGPVGYRIREPYSRPGDSLYASRTSALSEVAEREAWRAARDQVLCACGHRNVSHGYGEDAAPVGPFASRIGEGPCGVCSCLRLAATSESPADAAPEPRLEEFTLLEPVYA